jgi:hypothetical protein
VYTGYALVMGTALGLLIGTLFSAQLWIAPVVGAAVGTIVGAILDMRRSKDRHG